FFLSQGDGSVRRNLLSGNVPRRRRSSNRSARAFFLLRLSRRTKAESNFRSSLVSSDLHGREVRRKAAALTLRNIRRTGRTQAERVLRSGVVPGKLQRSRKSERPSSLSQAPTRTVQSDTGIRRRVLLGNQ